MSKVTNTFVHFLMAHLKKKDKSDLYKDSQKQNLLIYSSTLIQPVQSVDVILAHLDGHAKFSIGVINSYHRGQIALGEGIPEFIERLQRLNYVWFVLKVEAILY